MSTNSKIGILNDDETVTSIYCHWDGYLENNGKILFEHYQEEQKVRDLISLGSISSLQPNVASDTGLHSFDTPEKGVVIAYHRDRGEDLQIDKYDNEDEFVCSGTIEYAYLFKQNKWHTGKEWYVFRDDTNEYVPLKKELQMKGFI